MKRKPEKEEPKVNSERALKNCLIVVSMTGIIIDTTIYRHTIDCVGELLELRVQETQKRDETDARNANFASMILSVMLFFLA